MYKCDPNVLMISWPKVGPQEPNPALVRNLFGMYAGARGELTNVTQYFYNGLICSGENLVALGDVFGAAARDSMVHMRQLGRLILQYGGDPRLLSHPNGRATWWSSGAVSYQKDPIVMLKNALAARKRAAEEYRRLASCMEPEPRAVIQRILLNEEHYIELFQCVLEEMQIVEEPSKER